MSPKTRRLASGLGPHEYAKRKEFEVDPNWIDFELQGLHITFNPESDRSKSESYLADYVALDMLGIVHAGEIKAHPTYYQDPEYLLKLDRSERALSAIGVKVHRHSASNARKNPRRLWNINVAYCSAFTEVPPLAADAICNAIAKGGGTIALALVQEAIGGPTAYSRSVVYAALCRRLLSYDLDKAVHRDTAVVAPRTPECPCDIRAIHTTVQI